jgi:hemerythrin superfamily protein
MDIYNYLKKDHRKVADLMAQALSTRSMTKRKSLFQEIKHELTLHAETEQETFYAELEKQQETKEDIGHAKEEHEEILEYMRKLARLSVDGEKWMEQFGEFKHAVEHHVKEEEDEIFEKARDVLSTQDANRLAKDMEALKREREFKNVA